ncbi:MAG TPA: aspartate aminotransferase family protein [Candidatus Atribacteria bacterium]|jgi:4-aminobutyrate aminotransferase|nr:MAG: Aminotransferase class-III [Atribacteria bacterium 34_128]HAJ33514.1 aspartate aminotransferase family protein [Candidatus Atribacteria bacterium]
MSRNIKNKNEKCVELVHKDNKVIAPFSRVPYYPLVIKSGYGSIVEDIDGNKFIDFLSSAGALNTGHCHPKIVKAIKNQTEQFILYTSAYMYHKPLVDLAQKLIKITPGDFPKKVAFGLSGSDANDGVIKLARAYTGRTKIISFIRSYHGSTYGSISLSAVSLNMARKIGPLLPEIYHMPFPDTYRNPLGGVPENAGRDCLNYLKYAFKNYLPPDEVAVVIIEPIQGDAGLVVPPLEFMEGLYKLCKNHGILFVSEEVQQGMGRTGKWFGIEHFGIEPDLVVLAKALASGLPLSALIGRAEIMDSLEAPAHLFTTAGNPVCCAAALATIEVIEEEKLIENAKRLFNIALERFNTMKKRFSFIGEVRGLGLSIGVDLVKDPLTKERYKEAAAKICYRAWQKGLLLSFFSNSVLRIQPPLVITEKEFNKGIDIIEECMVDLEKGLLSDDILKITKGW